MSVKIGVLLFSIQLSFAYDNLALRKPTQMTHIHGSGLYKKEFSVDGNRTQNSQSCALTDEGYRENEWKVNLENIYSIRSVQIYYRNDQPDWDVEYRGRFAGFSLYISNTTKKEEGYLCFHEIQDGPNSPSPIMTINCTIHGRYVIYYNERKRRAKYPTHYFRYAMVELCEVIVNGCENQGVYGQNCNLPCPKNCQEERCFIVNGTCLGCKDGYLGSNCSKSCGSHFYGPSCQEKCGNCYNNITCNHVNGSCPTGCAAGYQGSNCNEECPPGKFGSNCIRYCSSNCKEQCDSKKGSCNGNCYAGWKGDACDLVCNTNFYGQFCNTSCGNCRDKARCHHINGSCANGCAAGYKGEKCITSCTANMYGEDCRYNCSSDCLNQTCNSQTGACIEVFLMAGDEEDSTNALPGIAGAVSTVFIVIIIISVVMLLKRTRQNTERKEVIEFSKRTQEDQALNITEKGQGSSDMYASVNKHKGPSSENQHTKSASHATSDVPVEDLTNDYVNNAVYTNTSVVQGHGIDELSNVIKNMQKDSNKKFKQEYETLPYGEREQCNIGKMDVNRVKNRFKTTFPYDHSRVVLQTDKEYISDYINANYINGLEKEKAYIAAQGPKNNTLTDFWRMIWQENVSQIVMLTNLEEGSKKKCTMYWPPCSEEMVIGRFKICNIKEKEYAYYVLREFMVVHTKNDQKRTITQYHYTAWPDHGTPESLSLVIFHSHVLRTTIISGAPLLVHCSAGIGRTGAYIALDALYKSGNNTGRVNVSDYVRTMRKNRMNMVQTSDQYIAIYLALWEALRVETRTFDSAQLIEHSQELFQDVPANKAEIRKEFNNLLLVRPVYGDEDFKLARRACGSNEKDKILPLDRYCLHLTSTVPNRGMFINAIAIPSYRKQKQFIITPYPTLENAVDLLRLLVDHDSSTVISMENLQDKASTSMWLPDEGSSLQIYPFEVKSRTKDLVQSDIMVTKIQLKNKESQDEDVVVTVVQPKANTDKRNDITVLRSMVNFILNNKHSGPVTVIGKNGVERCGIFCAIHNAFQQLDMDGVVDLSTIVRQIQIHRIELCSSWEEYQNCYRALSEQIQYSSENVYYNN